MTDRITEELVATRYSAEELCRSPFIEALTPTNDQWDACKVVGDRYDLMKRLIRAALQHPQAGLRVETAEMATELFEARANLVAELRSHAENGGLKIRQKLLMHRAANVIQLLNDPLPASPSTGGR